MARPRNNLIGALLLLAGGSSAMASTVTFDLGNVYTSSGLPALAGPWVRAEFTDTTTDYVQLTITRLTGGGTGMSTGEFISGFFFNTTLGAGVSTLGITQISGPGGVSFSRSNNGVHGNAGYRFDVGISFETANNSVDRFDETWPSAVFNLSRTGLTALDFDVLSNDPNGPNAPVHVGAHLQALPNGASAHVSEVLVPTPSAALAGLGLLSGLGVYAAARRRRQFRN